MGSRLCAAVFLGAELDRRSRLSHLSWNEPLVCLLPRRTGPASTERTLCGFLTQEANPAEVVAAPHHSGTVLPILLGNDQVELVGHALERCEFEPRTGTRDVAHDAIESRAAVIELDAGT